MARTKSVACQHQHSHANPRVCQTPVVDRQRPDIEVNEDENVEVVEEIMEERREVDSSPGLGIFGLFTG